MWSNECVGDTWEAVRRDFPGVGDTAASLKLIRIQLKAGVWFKDDIPQSEEQSDEALYQYHTPGRGFS